MYEVALSHSAMLTAWHSEHLGCTAETLATCQCPLNVFNKGWLAAADSVRLAIAKERRDK